MVSRHLLPVALLLSFVAATPVFSGTIVVAQAALDWSGFTYEVTGGLVIDQIYQPGVSASSHAATTQGVPSHDSTYGGSVTSASSFFANGAGSASATSSTNNGLLTSTSSSTASGNAPTSLAGWGSTWTDHHFWLYGHGVGTLTLNIPYTLSISVATDEPPPGMTRDEWVSASTSVYLHIGPGVSPNGYASASLLWDSADPVFDHTLVKNGVLTVSKSFSNPTWGPLVSMSGGASSRAVSSVPEVPTLVSPLLGLFLLLGFGVRARQRRARAAKTAQVESSEIG